MKRREFLNWIGVGFLASSFPVALAACTQEKTEETSSTQTTSQATSNVPDADGYLGVGTTEELNQNGYLINMKSNVIVFRKSSNALSAVSLLCTHQGCKVDWRKTSNSLFCACHGSEFATDGEVLNGPAQSPLPTFDVKEEGESILVKVS